MNKYLRRQSRQKRDYINHLEERREVSREVYRNCAKYPEFLAWRRAVAKITAAKAGIAKRLKKIKEIKATLPALKRERDRFEVAWWEAKRARKRNAKT